MFSHPLSTAIQHVTDRIQSILHEERNPFIHTSKISSLKQGLSVLLPLLQGIPPNLMITHKQKEDIPEILEALDLFDSILDQNTRENCPTCVCTRPINLCRDQIFHIRRTIGEKFANLKIGWHLLEISVNELNTQNLVDLRRICQLLVQLKSGRKTPLHHMIDDRFKSLSNVNIIPKPETSCVSLGLDLIAISHADVTLGKLIGRGQFGEVRLGEFRGETVAVKILLLRSLLGTAIDSFRREIYTQSSLHHSRIVQLKGYTEESPFYLVSEFMEHGSVFDSLRKSPDLLTPTMRSIIAHDVALGLRFLHRNGILHRDLKSQNVLLDSDYRAKISDFGLARNEDSDVKSGFCGTCQWMAPEVFMSDPHYHDKVDVYSYGIFLWELLTSKIPYDGIDEGRLPYLVVNKQERPLIPPETPNKLAKLIRSCWAHDPDARPPMSTVVHKLNHGKCAFPGSDKTILQKTFHHSKKGRRSYPSPSRRRST